MRPCEHRKMRAELKHLTPMDIRDIMESVRKRALERREERRQQRAPRCPGWRRPEPCDRVSDYVRSLFDVPGSRRWLVP